VGRSEGELGKRYGQTTPEFGNSGVHRQNHLMSAIYDFVTFIPPEIPHKLITIAETTWLILQTVMGIPDNGHSYCHENLVFVE